MRCFAKARAISWCVFIASVLGAPIALNAADQPNPSPTAATSASGSPGAVQKVEQNYGDLPLSFEANRGQADQNVRFLSRGSGYTFFLTPGEAVLAFSKGGSAKGQTDAGPAVFHMRLEGASAKARISGVDSLPGTSNYFYGQDPRQWRTAIRTFRKVAYENIYPGINLVYYGNQRQLEYDFVVAPGVDPRVIRLSVSGASKVTVDAEGDLVLRSDDGEVRLLAPKAYQDFKGRRREVAGQWRLAGNQTATFRLAAYDRSRALVIDPVLLYSSFLGGSQNTSITRIATDSAGNAYVAGYTASGDFPAAPTPASSSFGGGTSSRGAFVAKIDPTGSSLLYTTYLSGSVSEQATGLAVDGSGNVYVTGNTHSPDFPVLGAFQAACALDSTGSCADAFLTKIAPTGNALVYSTYLGGTGEDSATGLAVDSSGNAYVAGVTSSADFPATTGAAQIKCGGACTQNAFVAKFNPLGASLAYATYLGGSALDDAADIAVDASGSAYVTGQTSSSDFPLASPFQKACTVDPSVSTGACVATSFVAKLKADGSGLTYSTYLGGSLGGRAAAIAVDSLGSAYVTGSTQSADFPVLNAFQKSCGINAATTHCAVNAFVTKFAAAGNALIYSTYLGGSTEDEASGIAVDSAGNAHIVGTTASPDFPTRKPLQSQLNGTKDAFVAVLKSTGSALSFSTFHGGSSTENGSAVALDAKGNVYLTGQTSSADFPTLTPFQSSCAGTCSNAFVSKLSAIPQVVTPPVIAKSFGAATIPVNGTTLLTFSLSNPDAVNAQTGLAFTDTLPGSMAVASTPGITNTCGGTVTATAASTTISLSGAGLAVSPASCTVSVHVTDSVSEAVTNSVTVSSTNGGTGNTATASLTVVSPPSLSKTFTPIAIPLNGTSSLSFTVTNPNTAQSLSGIGFSDPFPAGMVISTPNGLTGSCGGGTITATQATAVVSLSGATLAASASCTFSVNVTGTTAGVESNTTGVVTSTEGGTGNTATATLTVNPPASISPTAGSGQTTTQGTAFGTALQATVFDSGSNPVSGVTVTFTAPGAGASGTFANGTATTTAVTNASGIATASTFTANSTAGAFNVAAKVAGVATAASFSLTSTPGTPNSITVLSGSGQTTAEGTAFANPLKATVLDNGSNPIPNASVTFTAPGVGVSGTFPGPSATATVTTDASGVATSPTFTANTHVGSYAVKASVSPVVTTANFSLTNAHGNATSISATAGTPQSTAAGTAFGTALQATVLDNGSNPVPGVTVTFTAPASGSSGTFSNGSATISVSSDSSGNASETFTANCILGSPSVMASVSGVGASATFVLAITVGPTKTVTPIAGSTPQSATVRTAFGTALGATLTDCGGNPEPAGITVTFNAPPGGPSGTFADSGTNMTSANTNASGVATAAAFTANRHTGSYPVSGTASPGGATTIFSLSNTVGTPSIVTASPASITQSAAVNTAFVPLAATVTDQDLNRVGAGIPVTFTAPASGATGTFSNATNTIMIPTDASGMVSAPFTANTLASPSAYLVSGTITNAGATNATYTLTNVPGPPATITVGGGTTPQNVAVTNTYAAPLSGTVTDSFGNTVLAGVNVKLAAPAGAVPSGTFATSGTNNYTAPTVAGGTFTATAFTANATAGAYNVSATSGAASAQYALVNTDFALSSTSPSIYIQGTSVPLATSTAPMITVTALPAPPTLSYTGSVTLACVAASLPMGVTCPSFTPATAVFANGTPSSVLSSATVNVSASTPVGLSPSVMVTGADTSPKVVTNTTSFALAVECTYSLGNSGSAGTLPSYSPLIPVTPYAFFVAENAGGSACPWNSLTTTAGITGIETTSGTVTAPGTGTSVPFGVTPIAANATGPQTDAVSVSYFQVNGASTTGTSTLSVVQELPVTLTGGIGTTAVALTASSITTANPGTLAFPNVAGLGTGVATICGAQNSSGPDTSGNNYFITCTAQVTGNTAQLQVTIGAATPASRPRRNNTQLGLLYSAGMGFPAIVFMGLGAAAFGPKRKRQALRRIASLLGVLLLLSVLVVLPACSGGFSATFINPSQVGTYTITVLGYVTDINNNVTAIEIYSVPMNVVK
ncbi:MAG TPA: SBBP repeat-containing protein [Candidatus Sulfotelmatobacter sp.]